MSELKGFGSFLVRTPKDLGWSWSADPRELRVGSLFGPKGVWVWVLCCHEPKGLRDGSWPDPGVFVLCLRFAFGSRQLGFNT